MRKTAGILLFALAACGGGKGKAPAAAPARADTMSKPEKANPPATTETTEGVAEDARAALDQYTIAVYSTYRPDTLRRGSIIDSVNLFINNFIVVTNKATHVADTLSLEFMHFAHSPRISIKDITREVEANKLVFILTYQGDSDNDYCEVIGYVDGTLKEWFDDPQPGGIIEIKKKGAGILSGLTWYETVKGWEKRPFTFSFKSNEMVIEGDDQ